jgi:hypothetical protein
MPLHYCIFGAIAASKGGAIIQIKSMADFMCSQIVEVSALSDIGCIWMDLDSASPNKIVGGLKRQRLSR